MLDISQHGLKIELKGSRVLKPAQAFWLRVKLSSFDIKVPRYLDTFVTCVWFSPETGTGGGVFADLSKDQEDIIERIIDYLKDNQPEVLSSNFDPTEEFEENDDPDLDEEVSKKPKRSKKNKWEEDLDDDDAEIEDEDIDDDDDDF